MVGQGAYGYVGAFVDLQNKEKFKAFKNISEYTNILPK